MQQFIDKLISRLEEEPTYNVAAGEDYIIQGNALPKSRVIEIVKQFAEEYKPRTNADRIRNMDNLELAKYLYLCPVTLGEGDCIHSRDDVHCVDCILEWLQSEVKE